MSDRLTIRILKDRIAAELEARPYVHKLLKQTKREAYQRHQGFISGLMTALQIVESNNSQSEYRETDDKA